MSARRRPNAGRTAAGPPPRVPQIAVAWRIRRDWNAVPTLRRVAAAALAAEGFRSGELSIAVVGRRAMARLHADSLNIPGPTDVLTFDLASAPRRGWVEGEIVVCADVAWQEARRALTARGAASKSRATGSTPGLTPAAVRELALYVVHGVLHLAGYDDHAPRDFARMHDREDEILTRAGLGPVFERGPASAPRSSASR